MTPLEAFKEAVQIMRDETGLTGRECIRVILSSIREGADQIETAAKAIEYYHRRERDNG